MTQAEDTCGPGAIVGVQVPGHRQVSQVSNLTHLLGVMGSASMSQGCVLSLSHHVPWTMSRSVSAAVL